MIDTPGKLLEWLLLLRLEDHLDTRGDGKGPHTNLDSGGESKPSQQSTKYSVLPLRQPPPKGKKAFAS